MTTVQEHREKLANLYPFPKWKKRVAKMTDEEVERFYRAKQEYDNERRRA